MKTSNISLQIIDIALQKPQTKFSLASVLKLWGQSLVRFFASSGEPQIWATTDRKGNQLWHIYDPASDRTHFFTSEAEVRNWIEQRYHQ